MIIFVSVYLCKHCFSGSNQNNCRLHRLFVVVIYMCFNNVVVLVIDVGTYCIISLKFTASFLIFTSCKSIFWWELSEKLLHLRNTMERSGRWVSGKLPEFGAIFMSNTKTRGECFSRCLFALPFASLEFVKKVRAGMVLFLFDYQERKLYGVFEAVSDGGLNMVPHAYTSSRKSFPAQVRFRIVWKCYPLREHEFRHVIHDNYYEEYKFNFGLSEDQVKRLIYLFESKRITLKKFPSEMNIKHRNSAGCSGGKKIKLRHCVDWDNQKSSIELSAESQSVQVLKDKESVVISSSAPLELGDFIPLFSPEHCDHTEIMATDDQSSPYCSKNQEHHPRGKGMYSDRIEEKNSVFSRLEESRKYTTDLDMERNRSSADEAMKVNKRKLLQRQKIQKGTNYVPNRTEIPKVANVFSRLNFNSESNKQEPDISKEKERRGHAEKNYLTDPVEMFDNQGKAVDNSENILFCKPEGKYDGDIGDRRHNHSPVSSCWSNVQQNKRKLVMPILSTESVNVCVRESNMDDQTKAFENSTVETKSLIPSDLPAIGDAMKYLEYMNDLKASLEN